MKKAFLSMVAILMLVSCGQTKKSGECCDAEKVETSPAKFTLTVINHTDQDMKWEQSWGMTSPTSGIVKAGDTVKLSSNEVQSDHINVYPMPPKGVDQPNPGNGTFGMQYGFDGHIARVYCDNVCNKGYPTAAVHYEGTNWIYETEWLLPSGVQTNTTNTVTITTKPFTHVEE